MRFLILTLLFVIPFSYADEMVVDWPVLQSQNVLKTPEDVVSYYCKRDSYGFIWSGFHNSERTAFTTWETSPNADMFQWIHNYKMKTKKVTSNEAVIVVTYDLASRSDNYGNRVLASTDEVSIDFKLKKINGKWLIVSPKPNEVVPMVQLDKMYNHFPYSE